MATGFSHLVQHKLPQPVTAAIASTLDLLEKLLEEENAIFEANQIVDHTSFTDRKNQLLRELIIIQRTLTDTAALETLSQRIVALKPLLLRNQELLKSNIRAVNEVARALKAAALDAEADGTYTRHDRLKSAVL